MVRAGIIGKISIVPCSIETHTLATPKRKSNPVSIGLASIDPNLWRISEEFLGEAEMMCKDGEVIANNNFVVSKQLMDTYAYHEIIYGPKPWGMPLNHPKPVEPLVLPTIYTHSNLNRIIIYTKFAIEKLDQATNIAYDIWLTKQPRFREPPKPGDVELMIWIYRFSRSEWLPPPAGKKIAETSIPTLINKNIRNALWEIWYHPEVAWGRWSYLAYVLLESSTDVAIDLTEILKHANQILKKIDFDRHNIDNPVLGRLYVNDIEIGTEVFAYKIGEAGIRWILKNFFITIYKSDVDSVNAFEYLKQEI